VLPQKLPEAISSQVARLLKMEREKRGFSLNLLAEKSGLSRQTITFVEEESRNPTLNTLFRMTLAMEIDPGELISKAARMASEDKKG
jgi:transcriptional regulator with XRE-family HTH domain